MNTWCIGLFVLLLAGQSAWAQDKAEINVMNAREEPIVMRFSYALFGKTWKIFEQAIPPGDDLSYRYPSELLGCATLRKMGAADGVLTVSNPDGMICEHRLSLCDKTLAIMDVRAARCTWRDLAPKVP